MEYKDFTSEIWENIHQAIEQACEEQSSKRIAAFDADGTLWNNDAGNAFFNYEIENKLIPLPANPWKHVYDMKDIKATDAFLWLAQIHKGVPLKTVKQWANESFQKNAFSYFPSIQKLIELLKSKNFEIYVVTASVKWAVEPCVKNLGIPESHVLGFETQVIDGVVTDKQAGISTYRAGKAEALLQKTGDIKPTIAVGNTMGDFWMLETAALPIAVRSINNDLKFQDPNINKQEEELYKEALKKGWLTHNFA